MILKATVQKHSPRQSLSKISSEAAVRIRSSKFRNSKTPVLEPFFNKVEEEIPTQVCSCEYCKTFKNSILYRTPPVVVFVSLIK